MRKIKPKKKDIEKKRKKVDELLKELFRYHGELHDEAKTLEPTGSRSLSSVRPARKGRP